MAFSMGESSSSYIEFYDGHAIVVSDRINELQDDSWHTWHSWSSTVD